MYLVPTEYVPGFYIYAVFRSNIFIFTVKNAQEPKFKVFFRVEKFICINMQKWKFILRPHVDERFFKLFSFYGVTKTHVYTAYMFTVHLKRFLLKTGTTHVLNGATHMF